MSRGRQILIVAAILLLSGGLAVVGIWQAKANHIPLPYVTGPLLMVVGAGFQVMHWTLSDDYLRRHFGGEANAARMRQTYRGGWIGVLIGAVMIAAEFFLGSGG